MNPLKSFGHLTYKALYDTIHHDGIEHAGYIAFLSVLSVFPFLVFFFAIAGFIGQSEVGTHFFDAILSNDIIPAHVMDALKPRLNEIASGPPQGLLTLSIIGAIWTASSMVEGLRTILNRAYRVRTPPAYIWRRLMSVAQFLFITGAIILVTLLFIITPNILHHIEALIEPDTWSKIVAMFKESETNSYGGWHFMRYATTTVVLFSMVVASYLIIPNTKQPLRDVFPGAVFVVLLWGIAGALFSQYLSHFDQVNIIYGSLGGMIAALLFFYICAMIYIFGAEFNYYVAKARGFKIEAKE